MFVDLSYNFFGWQNRASVYRNIESYNKADTYITRKVDKN